MTTPKMQINNSSVKRPFIDSLTATDNNQQHAKTPEFNGISCFFFCDSIIKKTYALRFFKSK
jgi:hypothetical protein